MQIDLQIERLILNGVDIAGHERQKLQAALETELTRLLTSGGLPYVENVQFREVPAVAIQLSPDSTPVQIGRQIARSVYGGLTR